MPANTRPLTSLGNSDPTIAFRGSSTIGELDFPDDSAVAPPLKRQMFRAAEGGRIAFDEVFEQRGSLFLCRGDVLPSLFLRPARLLR